MDSILFFLDRINRIDGIFSPSVRSPFGRRPFYPDDPVDPVQFSFKDENPFLIFGRILIFAFLCFLLFFFISHANYLILGGAEKARESTDSFCRASFSLGYRC